MKVKIDHKNAEEIAFELREYYRKNYRNGNSDESFLLWIETVITEEKLDD